MVYKLTQSFNPSGLFYGVYAIFRDPSLGIPNIKVQNISQLNPEKLRKLGFEFVVFDKDNVLTKTYSLEYYPDVRQTALWFKEVYGPNMILVTNSAGTNDDFGYEKKKMIEQSFGLHVLVHRFKKPNCGNDVKKYFSEIAGYDVDLSNAVMIGDRIGTDIILGGLNRMLTIHTQPFTVEDELFTVRLMRRFEDWCVGCFKEKGYQPKNHQNITLDQVIYKP